MTASFDHDAAEARFRVVFAHLGAVIAYARRRGSRDADALGAEVMTIAWRRLGSIPSDDARPWLYATARNLLLAERRQISSSGSATASEPSDSMNVPELIELDPSLHRALRDLSPLEREALLLTAWEDLTPSQAGRVLGVSATTFRVRLLRARRRVQAKVRENEANDRPRQTKNLKMEKT